MGEEEVGEMWEEEEEVGWVGEEDVGWVGEVHSLIVYKHWNHT